MVYQSSESISGSGDSTAKGQLKKPNMKIYPVMLKFQRLSSTIESMEAKKKRVTAEAEYSGWVFTGIPIAKYSGSSQILEYISCSFPQTINMTVHNQISK